MYDFDTLVDRRNSDAVKWRATSACHSSVYDEVIPMWIADMDFAAPPEVTAALKERAEHAVYGYTSAPEELYRAYILWMKKRHNTEVKRDWLSFSPGIVPAVASAIRAFSSKGEGIAITPPVYHPFKRLIEANDRLAVEAPLVFNAGRYELDLDALDKACSKSRLFILCSPHNPVGRVWNKAELQAIAEIANKHKTIVFADEIHGDLVYEKGLMLPSFGIKELYPLLISAWAPSKTFNIAGLQASIISVPDEKLMAALQKENEKLGHSSPNCMAPHAAAIAYNKGEAWLDEALVYMKGNYELLCEGLARKAPAIRVSPMEGTYLAWLDFRQIGLTGDINSELIERAGLWLDSGSRFGTNGDGYARFNLGCPRYLVEEAVKRLGAAFGS